MLHKTQLQSLVVYTMSIMFPIYRGCAFQISCGRLPLRSRHATISATGGALHVWNRLLASRSSTDIDVTTMDISDARRRVNEAQEILQRNLASCASRDRLEAQINDLEREQSDPDFWASPNSANNKRVTTQLSEATRLLNRMKRWDTLSGECSAGLALADELDGEDAGMADDIMRECIVAARALMDDGERFELEKLLSGKFDQKPARIVLTAGAGGTEACDWVDMLHRMYCRHAEKMEYRVTIEEKSPGDEVGYKKVEMMVEGTNAFGWLKGEKGAHRLVRLSPFNANNKRQTTFAGVDVVPVLDDEEINEVDIPDADVEITTMRSGGAGGQVSVQMVFIVL